MTTQEALKLKKHNDVQTTWYEAGNQYPENVSPTFPHGYVSFTHPYYNEETEKTVEMREAIWFKNKEEMESFAKQLA